MIRSDTDALAVLAAERELRTVVILLSALPVSDIARERLDDAVEVVRAGLSVQREAVGLRLAA